MISLSHVISQKTTVVGPYALFQVVLLFYLMMLAARLMLFTLYLQVLWWSWASHPLSPQALSCSCWLVPKSLRWETLLRTEPSSMELRNVGLLLAAFAILGTCHVPFWNRRVIFFYLFALKMADTTHCSAFSNISQLQITFSVFLQCLEWSSPLDRPLYMLWLACMATLQRWVLGYACSSSSRLIKKKMPTAAF